MASSTARDNQNSKDYLLLFSVTTVITVITLWKRRRILEERAHQAEKQRALALLSGDNPSVADHFYLQRAHKLRLELDPPPQSNFRVAAILLLESGSMVFGTNDEPSPNISMAMCAERCAFLKYRSQKQTGAVKAVYLTTDASTPVAPGTGCREYMYGHPATSPDTRIVMQSKESQSEPLVLSLGDLHPYPSIYTGLNPREQIRLGGVIQMSVRMELERLEVPGLSQPTLIRLLEAARSACIWDNRDSLHAMSYGAAIAIETDAKNGTIEILQASQIKALEYSSTLDAVCQLASQVVCLVNSKRTTTSSSDGSKPRALAVVQVDKFGIPHSLFAHARAFFVEHGFGDCAVILTSILNGPEDEGKVPQTIVQTVPAQELAPFIPEFRS